MAKGKKIEDAKDITDGQANWQIIKSFGRTNFEEPDFSLLLLDNELYNENSPFTNGFFIIQAIPISD